MNTERWQRVRELFESALEDPPVDVERWIADHSDDADVRGELASLLASHSKAGDFLSRPAGGQAELFEEVSRGLAAGQVLGPYQILGEAGRGGMGRVYRALDTRLHRAVAIKALPLDLAPDPSQRERLRREARAAAALSHPGICTVHALEEIDGELYIVSEFIEGQTLRQEIEGGPRPTAEQVLDTARQLAAALATAHAAGVIHRDLKPENVMRTADGRVKILDFGLARLEPAVGVPTAPVTQPGMILGTPAYMAPEQFNGGPVDARTDVFSFGVLIYEYASGEHPFEADTLLARAGRVLEGTPEPLAKRRPDLPVSLTAVLERCLRKSPRARFDSGAAIAHALDGAGPAGVANRPMTSERDAHWWRWHQIVVIGFYLTAAVLAWLAKEWRPGATSGVFIGISIATTIVGVLRAHLVFTERTHGASLRRERERTAPVTLVIDLLIGLALAMDGLVVAQTREVAGVLIIGVAVGIALARLVLEPATTTAAFPERLSD